jgi:hypothetical protein
MKLRNPQSIRTVGTMDVGMVMERHPRLLLLLKLHRRVQREERRGTTIAGAGTDRRNDSC